MLPGAAGCTGSEASLLECPGVDLVSFDNQCGLRELVSITCFNDLDPGELTMYFNLHSTPWSNALQASGTAITFYLACVGMYCTGSGPLRHCHIHLESVQTNLAFPFLIRRRAMYKTSQQTRNVTSNIKLGPGVSRPQHACAQGRKYEKQKQAQVLCMRLN